LKKALEKKSNSIQYIVADITESPINRPKEEQDVISDIIPVKDHRHSRWLEAPPFFLRG
jgi:hypothetical protein